jgi:hypothetical protein
VSECVARSVPIALRRDRHLLGDGPHEGDQFPRDRGHRHVGMLPARDESPEAFTEAHLGFPPEVLYRLWKVIDAGLNVRRHFRGMAIGPRGLDERAPRAPIARFGNPALAPRPTTGVLRRNETNEGGQLPRVVKAREIAELGDDGDRDEELDAA